MSTSKSKGTAKAKTSRLFVNRDVVLRAMGDDLVVVNDRAGKLAVINSTAKQILDGIVDGKKDEVIARDLESTHVIKRGEDLQNLIDNTRKELIAAGVLLERREFLPPSIVVRDLKTALKEMDLSRSTVSQYE